MSLSLLSLPILAIQQVLNYLNVADLIDFSLCSNRCKRVVQSIRHPYTGIDLIISEDSRTILFKFEEKTVGNWRFWMKPLKKGTVPANEVRCIYGMTFRVQKEPFWCSNRVTDVQFKIVYDYIQELFVLPVSLFFYNSEHSRMLPQSFGFETCESVMIYRQTEVPGADLKDILNKIQISKCLSLGLRNVTPEPRLVTVQLSMDELSVEKADWMSHETFLGLNCARISLGGTLRLPILEFILNWVKSGNKRLEYLKLSIVDLNVDWSKLQTRSWDQELRGKDFRLNRTNLSKSTKLDCSQGKDIIRDDGLLSTVILRGNTVYFVVWHDRHPNVDGLMEDRTF